MRVPKGCPLTQSEWDSSVVTFSGGDQLPSNVVAKRLRRNPSTVRSHLFKARRKLRAADNNDLRRIMIKREWISNNGSQKQRRDHAGGQEKPLSPSLKAYLAAFDDLLLNHDSPNKVAVAREQMRHHLAGHVIGEQLSPELLRGGSRLRKVRPVTHELPRSVLPGLDSNA